MLIENGISSNRLVAAGFGEHSPLIDENSEDAYKKNRRIEIKLTRGDFKILRRTNIFSQLLKKYLNSPNKVPIIIRRI